VGLFDVMAPDDVHAHRPQVPAVEFDQATLLKGEKEALGLYVSSHPLQGLREQLREETEASVATVDDRDDGVVLWTGGIVANAQKKVSKNGGIWLAFRLEDVDGGVECRAWPAIYEQFKELLVEDAIVKVKGRVERKAEAGTTLIALEVLPFSGVSEYRPLTLTIDAARLQPSAIEDLARVLSDFPGEVPVVVNMVRDEQTARLRVGDRLRVAPVAGLYAELKALLGESCISAG